MKKRATLFGCIGMAMMAHAQNLQPDSLTRVQDSLKSVTVTATRTTKDVMDVGRSVTIISAEQIKQAGCGSVAQLLSQQEGIFIVGANQNPGAIQSLFMRGADNNNTTIMMDGVPITDPSTDHSEIDLNELSLADVDRIEIVRGSQGMLYGSSSIGGVINIITKKKYASGLHVTASVMGGTFGGTVGEGNLLANYTFTNGFYVTGGVHYITTKGLNATVDTIAHPKRWQLPDSDSYNKLEKFAKVGYVNSKWDIFAEYRNLIQNSDADQSAYQNLDTAKDHFVRDSYLGGITYKVSSDFNVQYTAGYSHDFRLYTTGRDTIDAFSDIAKQNNLYIGSRLYQDIKAEYDYKKSHFIAGFNYTSESMNLMANDSSISSFGNALYQSSLDSVKPKQNNVAFYAQADLSGGLVSPKLDSTLSLLLGARYTNNSVYGSNFSYNINPYYRVNRSTMLYLSYSTGFTTPSLYQLYAPNKDGDDPATSFTLGNSKLTSETSNSFEVGVKHRVSNSVYFTLAWFKTVVNNYIDYVYLWKKGVPTDSLGYGDFMGDRYLNVGKQTTQGFEMSVFVKLSKNLDVSGNISILSAKLEYSSSTVDTTQTHANQVQIFDGGGFLNTNSATTSNGLLRRPGTLGNFALTYRPANKLSLILRARYVGSHFDAQYVSNLGPYGADGFVNVSDYTLVDVFASYDITKSLFAMVRAENIFNAQYSEIPGYTTIGRAFYINLRYSF